VVPAIGGHELDGLLGAQADAAAEREGRRTGDAQHKTDLVVGMLAPASQGRVLPVTSLPVSQGAVLGMQLGQDLNSRLRLGGEADLLGDPSRLPPVRVVRPLGGQAQPGGHAGAPPAAGVGGVDDVGPLVIFAAQPTYWR
jgi:hypothetical protein